MDKIELDQFLRALRRHNITCWLTHQCDDCGGWGGYEFRYFRHPLPNRIYRDIDCGCKSNLVARYEEPVGKFLAENFNCYGRTPESRKERWENLLSCGGKDRAEQIRLKEAEAEAEAEAEGQGPQCK